MIYYLGAQWSIYEQYSYGWAAPFLCLYLIWQSAKRPAEGVQPEIDTARLGGGESRGAGGARVGADTSPLPSPRTRWSGDALCVWIFVLCALLYAPTRFLHEANPIWRLTSWLWAIEVIGLTLIFVRWASGVRCLARVAFAICLFLVAVPWPTVIEAPVIQGLMRADVGVTIELLGLVGVPAVQHGNVIEIAAGMVGIDEACSGIRSLQVTLMISLFLGEFYVLSAWCRVLGVFTGFALAFLLNVGRTLLLTWVAAAKGVDAIASWHDPAGVTILVADFFFLWLVARALGKTDKAKAEPAGVSDSPTKSSKLDVGCSMLDVPFSLSAFQRLSLCLTAWLLVVEGGTELWYRFHERAVTANAEWTVRLPDRGATYHEIAIPSNIRGQFQADKAMEARWQDGSGHSWQLYYFRWFAAHSLKGRVASQLAKVHGPEVCLPAAGMSLRAYLGIIMVPVAGMELAMQQFVFDAEGRPVNVFYGIYEDPSGSTRLANRRQDSRSRVEAALAGSRNYGQRFFEVAASGYESPEDAKAALANELEKLIKVDR